MSDCGCDQLEKHVEILKEILVVRANIEKEASTPRVGILMRMVAMDAKNPAKAKTLRKELIQAAAACIMHLETL